MFADAFRRGSQFTRPVIISLRRKSGKCDSIIGTFVVLNDQGYILTAEHIFRELAKLQKSVAYPKEYEERVAAIEANPALNRDAKRAQVRQLKNPGPDDVVGFSPFWS